MGGHHHDIDVHVCILQRSGSLKDEVHGTGEHIA